VAAINPRAAAASTSDVSLCMAIRLLGTKHRRRVARAGHRPVITTSFSTI
jgi:hypothetical protein